MQESCWYSLSCLIPIKQGFFSLTDLKMIGFVNIQNAELKIIFLDEDALNAICLRMEKKHGNVLIVE